MRVKIVKPFSVDAAKGRVRYQPGDIVPSGQKNWVSKGLAVEAKEPKPKPKPEPKSGD